MRGEELNLAGIARRRSSEYRRIASTFAPPASSHAPRLGREYSRLFAAPGSVVYPYESMHRGPFPRVMGDSTLEVIGWYRGAGFMVSGEWRDLPDHIALELLFVGALAESEARRWRKREDEAARATAEIERRFIEDHLLAWVPGFCDAVLRATKLELFRNAADRLRHLLPQDHDWLLTLASEAR